MKELKFPRLEQNSPELARNSSDLGKNPKPGNTA